MKVLELLLWIFSTGVVAHGLYYWGKLPDNPACHYDIYGEPDNHCSKQALPNSFCVQIRCGRLVLMAIYIGIGGVLIPGTLTYASRTLSSSSDAKFELP